MADAENYGKAIFHHSMARINHYGLKIHSLED